MNTGHGVAGDYPLGDSSAELARLERQAAFFGDLTEDLLRRAGIVQGMRVLDIGCDAGDVSLLTARLVGPTFDYGQGGRETLRTVERTLSKL
jgi:hypothetical protein